MPYRDLWNSQMGYVPGLPFAEAQTQVKEALTSIYNEQLWSFQLGEFGWLTPGLLGGTGNAGGTFLSPGTINVQPYATTITGNAVASAAWLALVGRPFLTEQQIRVPYYGLYNIVAVNATVPTAVVLTIDRPWMEPAQVNTGYMIYQAYFVAPLGFKKFYTARDTTNNSPMNYWTYLQTDLARIDPQRTQFNEPAYLVPYRVDQRVGSATPGQMLYELWPHPLSKLPYTMSFLGSGPALVLATDTVPYPLTEEMVKWRAREVGFLWKESQKGEQMQRGSGADWRFLAQEAHAQYVLKSKEAKMLDQNMIDLYFSKFDRDWEGNGTPYATVLGQLNVGRF